MVIRNAAAAPAWIPVDGDYESRVPASFERQAAIRFIGARLVGLAPGTCSLELDCRSELTQQRGYVHAGIVGTIAIGEVVKAGRTLVITRGEVFAHSGAERVLCAIMQQTLMVMHARP